MLRTHHLNSTPGARNRAYFLGRREESVTYSTIAPAAENRGCRYFLDANGA